MSRWRLPVWDDARHRWATDGRPVGDNLPLTLHGGGSSGARAGREAMPPGRSGMTARAPPWGDFRSFKPEYASADNRPQKRPASASAMSIGRSLGSDQSLNPLIQALPATSKAHADLQGCGLIRRPRAGLWGPAERGLFGPVRAVLAAAVTTPGRSPGPPVDVALWAVTRARRYAGAVQATSRNRVSACARMVCTAKSERSGG